MSKKKSELQQLFCISLNHKSISTEQRGQIDYDRTQVVVRIRQTMQDQNEDILAICLLDTCNRIELHGMGDAEQARTMFHSFLGISDPELAKKIEVKTAETAALHLFHVAAGLDSQLIGDSEVLGQFKRAFVEAKRAGHLTGYLERLVNKCIECAKEVRATTKLTTGVTSLAYAVIKVLRAQHFDHDPRVLIVGAGKMAERIAKNICKYIPQASLSITNRTAENSVKLSRMTGAEVVDFSAFRSVLGEYDVIISSFGGKHKPVDETFFNNEKRYCLIDLSVPQFFDAKLQQSNHIELVTLDQASRIINDTIDERISSLPQAMEIVARHFNEFYAWSQFRSKAQAISKWKEIVTYSLEHCPHFEEMQAEEKESFKRKYVQDFVDYLKNNLKEDIDEQTLIRSFIELNDPFTPEKHRTKPAAQADLKWRTEEGSG